MELDYQNMRAGSENVMGTLYQHALFTQKHQPWLPDVDLFIMQLQATGLLEKILVDNRKNIAGVGADALAAAAAADGGQAPIRLAHLYIALMVLAAGYIVGSVAIGLETLTKKCKGDAAEGQRQRPEPLATEEAPKDLPRPPKDLPKSDAVGNSDGTVDHDITSCSTSVPSVSAGQPVEAP